MKEIQHHAALQGHAAVRNAIFLQEGVSRGNLYRFLTNGEAKTPGDDVSQLRMRVTVKCPHCAGLKRVFHTHDVVVVGKHAADHTLSSVDSFGILVIQHGLIHIVLSDQ